MAEAVEEVEVEVDVMVVEVRYICFCSFPKMCIGVQTCVSCSNSSSFISISPS